MRAASTAVLFWPLAALGGCSEAHECGAPTCASDTDAHSLVDAAGADAAGADADAADADAIGDPGSVTVVMRVGPLDFGQLPIVVFHDEAGVPVEVLYTDADGIASSRRSDIAAVTVAPGYDADFLTILGVVRGDTLRFEPGFVERQLAAPDPPPDATRFTRSSACSVMAASSPVPYGRACVGGGPTHLVLFAHAPAQSYYLAMFGGPATDPVRFGPWRARDDVETIPCALTGVAPASSRVAFAYVATGYGGDVHAGLCEDGTLRLLRGIPEEALVIVDAIAPASTSRAGFAARVALTEEQRASGVSIDLSMSPRITSVTADTTDPEHISVSWTATGDYAMARLRVGPAYYGDVWNVVAAAPVTRIELPQLPDELARIRPVPGVTEFDLTLTNTPEARDYTGFRSHPIGPRDPLAQIGTRAFAGTRTF